MRKVGTHKFGYWTSHTYLPDGGEYRCVKDDELPRHLAEAFHRDFSESDSPAGYCYLHELVRFMAGHNPIAMRYTGRAPVALARRLEYKNLAVPVWLAVEPARYKMYPGEFVRYEDMPEDLGVAFFHKWMSCSACPGHDMAYAYDFADFMGRSGVGWSGDFSEIVGKYR